MEKNKNKIKILLIDNDEMIRIYFRDIFWIHGYSDNYEVKTASSISEAEEALVNKEINPDVIFLGAMMSTGVRDNNLDEQMQRSLSFVERIKNDKDLSPVKIIIFTGHKEESIKNAFLKLKVDGFLIKSEFMPKEILAFADKIYEANN